MHAVLPATVCLGPPFGSLPRSFLSPGESGSTLRLGSPFPLSFLGSRGNNIMPTKYSVTALDRRPQHPNCHRAGRAWPSGEEVIIEVLEQDDDPMLTKKRSGEPPLIYPDPVRLGRVSFAKLQGDNLLVIRSADVEAERKDLLQTAADSRRRAAEAEAKVERMKVEIGKHISDKISAEKKHAADLTKLEAKVAELEAQLDEATTESAEHATQRVAWMDTANKHFAECERLTAKVAELEQQLDEATSPSLPTGPDHAAAPSVALNLDPPAQVKKRK